MQTPIKDSLWELANCAAELADCKSEERLKEIGYKEKDIKKMTNKLEEIQRLFYLGA